MSNCLAGAIPPPLEGSLRIMEIRIMQKEVSPRVFYNLAFILLGCIFIFSGIGKIVKVPDAEYIWVAGILGDQVTGILWRVMPYVEIIIGVLLVMKFKIKLVAWFTMGLILNFMVNNTWLIANGRGLETCGECLGWGIDLWPIGSLYIDILMVGLLLVGATYYKKVEAKA